ncbi:MAG: hypothetical protein AMJ75_10450 [Phycisphaerae bacterium SM1_79]|nr:MAG: hypothetical protein AMJ75_10450 [Phycisphaerae bacterium SM1_79]
MRKLVLTWVIVILGLAGCASDKIGTMEAGAPRLETCADMVAYLQDQNLPTLESVEAWTNEYGPGVKLTTAHYEIFATLLKSWMLRRAPGFIESAYQAYNSQLPEPIETNTKFTIYLFADRRQWADFTRTFAGEQAETFCRIKAGAYYHNGACVAYDIDAKRTFSVLGHEGWHQFNGRHFKFRLPSWLDEGVAMLFEAHRIEDGAFYFEPAENAHRLDALKRTLSNNQIIPLRALIATNPGDVLATDQTEAAMAFYSQSYALVRFLREAGYGQRLGIYHQLLADGLRGDWPLDDVSKKIAMDRNIPRNVLWNHIVGLLLFQAYIGDDFGQIEKEYLAFCRQITADQP